MSEGLRIDLALARAAGLPERAANDARLPSTALPMLDPASRASSRPVDTFSPLALLLARFLPPTGATTPPAVPTPEEARLLQAYLQQRVVAALRDAGVLGPAAPEVRVDADGALRLTPAPPGEARYAPLLRHDPDITQLAVVLQHALLAQATTSAHRSAPGAPGDHAIDARGEPVRWPWWLSFDTAPGPRQPLVAMGARTLWILVIVATLLAWWLFR